MDEAEFEESGDAGAGEEEAVGCLPSRIRDLQQGSEDEVSSDGGWELEEGGYSGTGGVWGDRT